MGLKCVDCGSVSYRIKRGNMTCYLRGTTSSFGGKAGDTCGPSMRIYGHARTVVTTMLIAISKDRTSPVSLTG